MLEFPETRIFTGLAQYLHYYWTKVKYMLARCKLQEFLRFFSI